MNYNFTNEYYQQNKTTEWYNEFNIILSLLLGV